MFAVILFAFALMQAPGVQETAQPTAETRSYLELQPEQLRERIPGLKTLQPAQDQLLLPTILSKTGARVDDFLRQVVDLTAHEQINQERLDETGQRKSKSEYSYLVLLYRNDLSDSPEEYRVDANGNRSAPAGVEVDWGYAVTSGFASECLHFLPTNQPNSRFRFLGTETMRGRSTYVVAFAQRIGHTTNTNSVNLTGLGIVVPTWVQGIAWIDQQSFQILRMRTDLLEPLFPNASRRRHDQAKDYRQTTEITLVETRLLDVPHPLWLPSEVNVRISFSGVEFHNKHRYRNYQRFRASSRILTP